MIQTEYIADHCTVFILAFADIVKAVTDRLMSDSLARHYCLIVQLGLSRGPSHPVSAAIDVGVVGKSVSQRTNSPFLTGKEPVTHWHLPTSGRRDLAGRISKHRRRRASPRQERAQRVDVLLTVWYTIDP